MQVIKADSPELMIDWIRDHCMSVEVFREIKDWSIQKLQQSMDKNPHNQDQISYLLSPVRVTPAVGETFDGYSFEIMIGHPNAAPEIAITFFRTDTQGRITGTLSRKGVLSWATAQDDELNH
jgi:hypothetical protein